jgi:hypothetical protein
LFQFFWEGTLPPENFFEGGHDRAANFLKPKKVLPVVHPQKTLERWNGLPNYTNNNNNNNNKNNNLASISLKKFSFQSLGTDWNGWNGIRSIPNIC